MGRILTRLSCIARTHPNAVQSVTHVFQQGTECLNVMVTTREVSGSTIDWKTGHFDVRGFPLPRQGRAGLYLRIRHVRFFQFL